MRRELMEFINDQVITTGEPCYDFAPPDGGAVRPGLVFRNSDEATHAVLEALFAFGMLTGEDPYRVWVFSLIDFHALTYQPIDQGYVIY